jgi:hypothetical protein
MLVQARVSSGHPPTRRRLCLGLAFRRRRRCHLQALFQRALFAKHALKFLFGNGSWLLGARGKFLSMLASVKAGMRFSIGTALAQFRTDLIML